MSFGSSQAVKNATNTNAGITQNLIGNSGTETKAGGDLLNLGGNTAASGTNFFQTLLNGNQANTTSLLQPNIDQIRQGTQQSLQAANTMMPRGGGRAGTDYAASFAPQSQITSLFNGVRSNAAQPLISTGLQQQGLGTNLFQIGNSALTGGGGVNANTIQSTLAQQQRSDQILAGLGQAVFGLATTPFGGGGGANGLLGLIGG